MICIFSCGDNVHAPTIEPTIISPINEGPSTIINVDSYTSHTNNR